jgi:hypothetical protein
MCSFRKAALIPRFFGQLKLHRLRLLPTARTDSSMEHSCSINNITALRGFDIKAACGCLWTAFDRKRLLAASDGDVARTAGGYSV